MAGGNVNFFDTLPDQQLHIASTNMTASNVIYSYDTLPDQWLHIALASMIIGDVIFLQYSAGPTTALPPQK